MRERRPRAVSKATDPQSVRRILHCDMDCFYAAVHVRDAPELRGRPVVIGGSPSGRGVVAAASYEARAYGIHSAQPAARALRLCPEAIFIRPDFRRYRAESNRIFAIFEEFTDTIQPVSIDEAYLDVSHHLEPLGNATAIAREIRRRVYEERELVVSIGVGPNKLVAKIASDFGKPDGLTVVKPLRVQAFLDPLSVRCLPGVGPASERRLKDRGIETIGQLRAMSLDELLDRFGRTGRWLYACARGEDDRPVRTERKRKSLSHERTFGQDLETRDQVVEALCSLAGKVASDLRQRELSASTITIKVRFGDFTTLTRSSTLVVPSADERVLVECALRLAQKTDAYRRPVRLLGVGGSNLVAGSVEQLRLFSPGRDER